MTGEELPDAFGSGSLIPTILEPAWSCWDHTDDVTPNDHRTIGIHPVDHDTAMRDLNHGDYLFPAGFTESSRNTNNAVVPQTGLSQREW